MPVEIALSPIELDDRLWVLASIRDVSARVESERQQQLIRRAIQATREAVFAFDQADLRFVYVNQGALAQTGYDEDELLDGMTPLHIAPEFTEAEFRDLLQPLVDGDLQNRTLVTDPSPSRTGPTFRSRSPSSCPSSTTWTRGATCSWPSPATCRAASSGNAGTAPGTPTSGRPSSTIWCRRPSCRASVSASARSWRSTSGSPTSWAGGRTCSGVGRCVTLLDPADVAVVNALLDPTTVTPGSAIEARLRTADDGQVWVEMGASPMEDPTDPDRVVVQFQDVTAQVEAASERERHRRALSTLADRERIARDLHDMVIQRLFAAGMGLQAVMPLADKPCSTSASTRPSTPSTRPSPRCARRSSS